MKPEQILQEAYDKLKGDTVRRIGGVPVGAQILVLEFSGLGLIWHTYVVQEETSFGAYKVTAPNGNTVYIATDINVCALTGAEALDTCDATMITPFDGKPITMYTKGYETKEEKVMTRDSADANATKNPANPKKRFGDLKRRVDLVPPALELGAAVGLAEGATKYGPYNWRVNHVEAMTYVGAIKRHIGCFGDGEDIDPESKTGKLHLEGLAACAAILLDSWYAGILIDDRPPKGPAPSLCRLPTKPAAPLEPEKELTDKTATFYYVEQIGKGREGKFNVVERTGAFDMAWEFIANGVDEKLAKRLVTLLRKEGK